MADEVQKTINITGTNNRYHIKKLIDKDIKKEQRKKQLKI